MNSQVRRCSQMLVVVLLLAISGSALAAEATKDEAVAMVKKAVAPSTPRALRRSMPRSATRKAHSSIATFIS